MFHPLTEIIWGVAIVLIACCLPGGWGHSHKRYYHPPKADVDRWGGYKP